MIPAEQALGLAQYRNILARRDDQHPNAAVGPTDVAVAATTLVCIGIQPQAEKIKGGAYLHPHSTAMLTDATREYERVDSAQVSEHASDASNNAMDEHLDRKDGVFLPGIGRRLHFPQVGRYPRYAEQTRFGIQNTVEHRRVDALSRQEVHEQPGIDRSRSLRHHQSLQWRKTHAGIDRPTIRHRRDRATGPEVADDHA